MSQPPRERAVSQAFVALADTLVDDYDIIDLLDQLVAHSVALLAADAAGLMLGDPHRQLRVVAASSEDAELMELLQLQNEQGPCMDCYRTGAPVRVPDLADATQWPAFTAAVAEAGAFRSVHALPLRLRREAIGAMNLFHRAPGPLPQADLALAKPWPTWPPSASCRNAPSAAARSSTNNSRPPSPAEWSSNRRRACSPNTTA
ncbi:MAG TPA: GAF domain-containing protein [Actinophytocola sp.]|nr:GAF domain-containing protein [Actinophytocola sp.]